MSSLNRVGLIGGTTWQSTATYYRLLNEAVHDRRGGSASAALTIWSMDFDDIVPLQEAGDWPAQGVLLADAARRLQDAGAAAIAVAANTLHIVADDIRAAIDVPFIDIVDETVSAARAFSHVGLLGTGYTMASPLFPSRFAAQGIEVIVPPDADDRQFVHDVIYQQLQVGIVSDASRERYLAVIEQLVRAGAGAVILGCTEISMLVKNGDASVPLLDTTEIHCAAIADVMTAGIPSGVTA